MKTKITVEEHNNLFQEGGNPTRYFVTAEHGNNWEWALFEEYPSPTALKVMTRTVETTPQSNNPRRVPTYHQLYPR